VEVLDFNVFLSPFDVWTAAITPSPVVSGTADSAIGARIATSDTSCTIPTFPAGGVDFRTLNLETTDNAAARTREGYFEVFEMATYADTSVIGINSKHSNGVPKDCSKVTDATAFTERQNPNGGLFGGVTILSPAGGGMFSQPATALANFRATAQYFDTGSTSPTYGDADGVSNVIFGTKLYQTTWGALPAGGAGFNAVTAVLMAHTVTNEYVLDLASKSQTTWIVTLPTKFNYVNSTPAIAPFTKTYVTKVGACENFYGVVFNREEGSPQIISSTDFSPQPGPGAGPQLCWEAQSIGFASTGGGTAASNVFGSANHNTISTPYSNGWSTLGWNGTVSPSEHSLIGTAGGTAVIDLTGVAAPLVGQTVTYFGLPVVGFAAETFQNDAISIGGKTYLSTFGASFPHHNVKKILP
jgi:hypothetical protein